MEPELQHAGRGVGPLLQRDYWAVLTECDLRPSQLMAQVKEHFTELPPPTLVRFVADHGVVHGADLDIVIVPAQHCAVRVVHDDSQSVTLGTLAGHPESGRITFGSYRNDAGGLLFHIRSRARASSASRLVGFLALGEAMQTNTWTGFINNTARLVGARILDVIHADTEKVEEEPADGDLASQPLPTFKAVGD